MQFPYQPLNVQRRVEHSQERKDSQKCKRRCRLDHYFQNKDYEDKVIRLQVKGSTSISKKRTGIADVNQLPCKKQTLVGRGSGVEEVDRQIADDQHQIDEDRGNNIREVQLQRAEVNRLIDSNWEASSETIRATRK